MSILVLINQIIIPKAIIWQPSQKKDCPGTRQKDETIRILASKISEPRARPGRCGIANIVLRLRETLTKIRPVSAAAAPAVAIK